MWSRALELQGLLDGNHPVREEKQKIGGFNNIYIGHTTVAHMIGNEGEDVKPVKACNVWNLDTGGGYGGKITFMNIDTEEIYQSDLVKTLYPDERGRD